MSQINAGKFNASTGFVLPRFSDSTRPTGEAGLMIFNTDTGQVQVFTGVEWISLTTANPQDFSNAAIFAYTGSDQQFSVPSTGGTISQLQVYAWGAGGGSDEGGTAAGGAGGYSAGIIERFDGNSLNGDNFTIVVGAGGTRGTGGSNLAPVYGGGGRGSVDSGGGHVSGCGGGLTGIFSGQGVVFSGATPQPGAQDRAIIIAGGGGGANDQTANYAYGGGGGGLEGGRGGSEPATNNKGGWGGRQESGYSGSNSSSNYANGSALRGADGPNANDDPGGGGGYYGGQSGGDDNSGAGGGSGWISGTTVYKVTSGVTQVGGFGSSGPYSTQGTDIEYWVAGTGSAARAVAGGDGRLVVVY